MSNPDYRRGNGPRLPKTQSIEDELATLTRSVERSTVPADQHPALAACKKAADMVRSVHVAHSEQGETLAKHLEHIGETFMGMCKEAADKIREQRILPEEMSAKMADELEEMGRTEAERQGRVKRGLTAARDAILGIDAKDGGGLVQTSTQSPEEGQ